MPLHPNSIKHMHNKTTSEILLKLDYHTNN